MTTSNNFLEAVVIKSQIYKRFAELVMQRKQKEIGIKINKEGKINRPMLLIFVLNQLNLSFKTSFTFLLGIDLFVYLITGR